MRAQYPGGRRGNGQKDEMDVVKSRLNVSVVLLMLLIVSIGFFTIIRIFLIPIVLATSLTILFFPMFEWIFRRMKRHRNIASILTCLAVLLIILIPLYLVVFLVAVQLINFISSIEAEDVQGYIAQGTGLLRNLQATPFGRFLSIDQEELANTVRNLLAGSGELIGRFVNRMSSGVLEIITTLFITLFSMFYFFRDGPGIVNYILYLSPLKPEYEENILNRFVLISRAAIQGTLLVGLIQGTLGGILLLATGVDTWLLWGIVMVILAMIPLLGPWIVLLPIGLILIFTGSPIQGILIIAISTLLVSTVDNFVRPRLVGHTSQMHDLMIFFSTLGGISAFGIIGFIIGPVVASLFLSVLEIYAREFKGSLDGAGSVRKTVHPDPDKTGKPV